MGMPSKYHVASGSFEVGATQSRRLEAFLGTCVGVAVYDAVAGVGGLIHLLLPEPSGDWNVEQPEKYAATGMPLFLNRLLDLGATRAKLEAVVAGGALVGPLTLQDLDLDIGGRTAETVFKVLDNAGVTVVQAETGGFFTCCIELDMQSWTCSIRPAGFDAPDAKSGPAAAAVSDIRQAIEAIRPIPQIALKVLRLIEDGSFDIDQVAAAVGKDQVISARTLQLCNSALFSKRRQIVTLDHALVYLGQELFLKLVISAAVQSYFNQSGNGYSLCKGGLYHHAIGTAVIAEQIAAETQRALPGMAYMAGLLHDIGKVVLDQFIVTTYPMLYREFQDQQSEIIAVENRVLGMDHTRVGELLARQWSLPACLTGVIRFHHQPEQDPGDASLTPIVYLADLLISRFHSGLELERIGTDHLAAQLARLGLSTTRLCELVGRIPANVFQPAREPT